MKWIAQVGLVAMAVMAAVPGGAQAAELLRVRLDQDVYFQKKDQRAIQFQVINEGQALAFVDVSLAPGQLLDGAVTFDFNRPVTRYDLFPATMVIPAGKTKTVRMVRHPSDDDRQFDQPGHEEYYRIRAVPKSADEALKANPTLWQQLNENDRQAIQDAGTGTTGTLQLNIGSGSVLVVQSGAPLNARGLTIERESSDGHLAVSVRNDAGTTLCLSDLRVVAGDRWVPVTEGNLVLRSGQSRTLIVPQEQLERLGTVPAKASDARLTFSLQDGLAYAVENGASVPTSIRGN